MDLDRARTNKPAPAGTCHKCKAVGHYAKDCPRRFEIHLMTTDELEEELARRRDLDEAQAHAQEVEESGAQTEEDFGTANE